MYDKILFLDFDGTITSEETLEGSMRRTIEPKLYEEKHKEMLSGKLTLSQVLHMGFGTIPSSKLGEIMDYVKTVPIRKGFEELLDAMQQINIPVVVISGGLSPYVNEKLAPYKDKLLNIHSVDLDCNGPYMKLISDYEQDGEIMQKTLIMAEYDYNFAICAGDSYTDVRMAHEADLVFARDNLAVLLDKKGKHYEPWNDFHDIRNFIMNFE
ncbi:HAD-IB family phosphatase [Paratissierella segnis]|jgi:2-hydroxy-3-keto-5-methylthiopentenyl-1-phosphate phosphatase|uniref:HAD-IB family phosphatase n=1 Tax=Paratissierella segnis TaxID=2763679 RepID=A0A926EWH7_9FIRM|nr:HAD-IB family phosphatase [Paratissierella segnis]MBC8587589.1 HAD-IB family phosphatase [Paratissierella segnis]